jgi:hypothetical protein
MALLVALIFISVAVIVLTALAARQLSQRNLVTRFDTHNRAFFGLEAGVAGVRMALESGDGNAVGLGTWENGGDFSLQPDFEQSDVAPLVLQSMGDVEYMAYAQNWMTDGIDNNGDGTVDQTDENWTHTVHSFARVGDDTRQLEVVMTGADVNVWRNAIFAGAGQSGGLINGNVSIHGAVHLLGQNVVQGNTVLSAIDLSGTSLIHNNYVGIPADLAARVPPLPTRTWGPDANVQTLDATLRVKNGLVGMSGNSEVGSPDDPGNAVKETMDGTYVNDGWTGNAVVPDGNRGDPKSVWSDNGWDELYDLGDKVPFPLLSDDWRAPLTGVKTWNDTTGDWYTHEDYFSEVLLAEPKDDADGIHEGSITIDASKSTSLYWNASTETKSTSLPASLPPATQDYLIFDANTDTLYVNGQIRINGDLNVLGKGNQKTIHYSGRAAILVDGNVSLNTDLLTCNNGNKNDYAESFPVKNILGIMASQDMAVGAVSQISLMGAFYAQGTITSSKQTTTMGTFVAQYFDMGTNVPDIYQVPSLADNLPLGMIGNYPILAFQQVSWREIGVDL